MTVISLPRVRNGERASTVSVPAVSTIDVEAGRMRLLIYRDFESIRDQWCKLENEGICVPAQSYERARLWFNSVSDKRNRELAIACGFSENGKLQFLWPMEVDTHAGIRCLHWIGWEQSNYNMGLYTLDFSRRVTAADMKKLLAEVARLIGNVSAASFDQQPLEWDGAQNPFALLPHQESANSGHAVLLDTDFDTLYRNRFSGKSRNTLGRKERRLAEHAKVEMGWAKTAEERKELLKEFFDQKSVQFAEQGIADIFSEDDYRTFYERLASMPTNAPGTLEFCYLKAGEQIAAISCGVFLKDKFVLVQSSIIDGDVRKYSPGALLLQFQIRGACARGLNFYDMGAGDARHKSEWCDVHNHLIASMLPLDEKGYALSWFLQSRSAVKRFIKTSPWLWSIARKVRRSLYGNA